MKKDKYLEIKVKNIKFQNPVLLASGTAGDGQKIGQFIDLNQLGGIITKTLTFNSLSGNPPPRIWEVPYGLINSIGLENCGVKNFVFNNNNFFKKLKTKIIISVGGREPNEFSRVINFFEKNKSDYVSAWELNVSCPNINKGGLLFSRDPETLARIVKDVRHHTSRPIFLKLSLASDYLKVVEISLKNGADGFSLINTLPAMVIDIKTGKPCLGGITGGFSGPALKPVALAAVYEVWKRFKVPIIGGGGIFTAEDALEFIIAGASLIAVGTANFLDPTCALKIIAGLKQFVKAKKFKSISLIKGIVLKS